MISCLGSKGLPYFDMNSDEIEEDIKTYRRLKDMSDDKCLWYNLTSTLTSTAEKSKKYTKRM